MIIMTSEQQHNLAAASPDRMFLNGVCSDTIGLYVDTPPMPPMPEEKVELTETPYANGNLYGRTGMYEDITITVKCFVFDGGYYPGKIYGFLQSAKTLSFGNTPEYYYKVKRVLGIIPQYQKAGKNVLNVQFLCAPFRYRKQNNPVTFTESPAYVVNSTNIYHEPVFRINFTEDALSGTFFVNDVALQLVGAAISTRVVIIDTERKKVYSDDNGTRTIVQQYTTGKFWNLVLPVGENKIRWGGTIESVTMTQNVRWL